MRNKELPENKVKELDFLKKNFKLTLLNNNPEGILIITVKNLVKGEFGDEGFIYYQETLDKILTLLKRYQPKNKYFESKQQKINI